MRGLWLDAALKGKGVDIIDGDLAPVQRDRRMLPSYATEAERRQFYQQLHGIAQQRGYSAGFAFYKYQEKFAGAKPPWSGESLPPIEPEPHVLAWVNARAREYARTQSRGAA